MQSSTSLLGRFLFLFNMLRGTKASSACIRLKVDSGLRGVAAIGDLVAVPSVFPPFLTFGEYFCLGA